MQAALLQQKLNRLRTLLMEMGSAVVAYSGGIDSTFVLKVAHDQLHEKVIGITAISPTFPSIELEAAERVAQEIGARHETVQTDQLSIDDFVRNDATRCFHCKTDLYRLLGNVRQSAAAAYVVDGTNVDDLGMTVRASRPRGNGTCAARSLRPNSQRPIFARCEGARAFQLGKAGGGLSLVTNPTWDHDHDGALAPCRRSRSRVASRGVPSISRTKPW